jgi:hypothetical protein
MRDDTQAPAIDAACDYLSRSDGGELNIHGRGQQDPGQGHNRPWERSSEYSGLAKSWKIRRFSPTLRRVGGGLCRNRSIVKMRKHDHVSRRDYADKTPRRTRPRQVKHFNGRHNPDIGISDQRRHRNHPAESPETSATSPATDSDAYSPPPATAPTGSNRRTMPKCEGPKAD